MKSAFVLYLLVGLLGTGYSFGQVGERVNTVKVLTMTKDTVSLPFLGQKNVLIFYADPSHPGQNKAFRDYFKTHPITNPDVVSYGVINLAAAPLIPNGLIRKMAAKETQGTDARMYLDPDHVLSTAWKLPGADNNFAVIFINKAKVIEFYKAGQLTPEEEQKVIGLVNK